MMKHFTYWVGWHVTADTRQRQSYFAVQHGFLVSIIEIYYYCYLSVFYSSCYWAVWKAEPQTHQRAAWNGKVLIELHIWLNGCWTGPDVSGGASCRIPMSRKWQHLIQEEKTEGEYLQKGASHPGNAHCWDLNINTFTFRSQAVHRTDRNIRHKSAHLPFAFTLIFSFLGFHTRIITHTCSRDWIFIYNDSAWHCRCWQFSFDYRKRGGSVSRALNLHRFPTDV